MMVRNYNISRDEAIALAIMIVVSVVGIYFICVN